MHAKCIQNSTNMPNIESVIGEIALEISKRTLKKITFVYMMKNGRVLSVNIHLVYIIHADCNGDQ